MARNIQLELEHEADKKGLEGEERKRYIGGAWNHIRSDKQHRAFWRESDDYRALSAVLGPVESLRTPKSRPDKVVFRQGKSWFELPIDEYHRLVDEGRRVEHEKEKDRKRHEREERKAIALYERELAREKKEEAQAKLREEREKQKAARAQEMERAHYERQARGMERAEYSEVLAIIRRAGGIRRGKTASGHEEEREEYNRNIPVSIRTRKSDQRGHAFRVGITADEAAQSVNEHMPWLNLQTSDDLYNYFERQEDRRNNRRAFLPAFLGMDEGHAVHMPVPVELPEPQAKEDDREYVYESSGAKRDPSKWYVRKDGITVRPDMNALTKEEREQNWLDVFGEAQPVEKQPEAGEAFDIFGGISSTKQKHSSHKHVWEPWRSDWRYMRCVKCGEMKASSFNTKVDK